MSEHTAGLLLWVWLLLAPTAFILLEPMMNGRR
jgi:hypothetical protein